MASSASLLQVATASAPVFSPPQSRRQPAPQFNLRCSHRRRRGISLAASSAASPEVQKEPSPSSSSHASDLSFHPIGTSGPLGTPRGPDSEPPFSLPPAAIIPPPPSVKMATAAAPARAVGPTRLAYFDDMWALCSHATVLAVHQEESGRRAVVLDATVFHPQGGGQPANKGVISAGGARFLVEDVRTTDGVVFHYGRFEGSGEGCRHEFNEGENVNLAVDAERRNLHSRLHSAGHLLDICMSNVGLSHLEPGKGYHFPDGAFVEYKGVIPPDQIQDKQNALEREANKLISKGDKVLVSVFPYEEAAKLCGGSLPSYISKDSTPRIVKFGDHPGCPCGGTHVADISVINNLEVTNIRVKKGLTKFSYNISP